MAPRIKSQDRTCDACHDDPATVSIAATDITASGEYCAVCAREWRSMMADMGRAAVAVPACTTQASVVAAPVATIVNAPVTEQPKPHVPHVPRGQTLWLFT